MTRVEALVVPSAPLLVPAASAGSASADEELRGTVRRAVAQLLEGDGPVTVIGDAPTSGGHDGAWDWRGFGLRARDASRPRLPLALALGDWLVDEIAPSRPRRLVGVDARQGSAACEQQGRELASEGPLRLLAVADGSARRSEKAPGHLDPRAEAFDDSVEQALRAGDSAALLGLDAALARDLLAAGRASWQVLAGAAGTAPVQAEVLWSGAPYGVAYVVARWSVA